MIFLITILINYKNIAINSFITAIWVIPFFPVYSVLWGCLLLKTLHTRGISPAESSKRSRKVLKKHLLAWFSDLKLIRVEEKRNGGSGGGGGGLPRVHYARFASLAPAKEVAGEFLYNSSQ